MLSLRLIPRHSSLQTRSGISFWAAQAACVHSVTPSSMGKFKSELALRYLSGLDNNYSINLDLEGGSELYWPTFVNQLKSYANRASKRSVRHFHYSHNFHVSDVPQQVLHNCFSTVPIPRCEPRHFDECCRIRCCLRSIL